MLPCDLEGNILYYFTILLQRIRGSIEKILIVLQEQSVELTLSINCKDAGDPVCTHTMYGETEEELLKNAKEHGFKVQDTRKRRGMKKFQRIQNILGNHKENLALHHRLPNHTSLTFLFY